MPSCKYHYMNLHQQNQYTISIIGLGKLGTALGNQLIGCTVKGWDVVDTDNSIQTDTLYEAICDADTIFIVVPSEFFVETIMSIIRAYSDHGRWIEATRVNMVSFTKGICNNKLPIDIMKKTKFPVIFDATHSVQQGAKGGSSGSQKEFIEPLAKAAIAVGVDGLFMEVHDNPDKALSDGTSSLHLDDLTPLLKKLKNLYEVN